MRKLSENEVRTLESWRWLYSQGILNSTAGNEALNSIVQRLKEVAARMSHSGLDDEREEIIEIANILWPSRSKEKFRLRYNKATKKIDKVRLFDGLAVESFEPPEECA